jgi:hypothetical protein
MWQWPRKGESRSRGAKLALVAIVALVASVFTPISPISPISAISPAAAQTSPNAGGEFTPVNPFRVFDSRPGATNVGGFVGPLRGQQATTAQVAGVPGSGIPASGVLAVAMNVTVAGPTASAYLTVWPAGAPAPTASNLNFGPGDVLPNLVVSAVGTGGRVGLFTNAGSTHVIIDVVGWYASSAVTQRGARLVPLSPTRILDTRIGLGAGPLGAGGTFGLRIRGNGGVPSNNVSGVILNVTATGPTAHTFVTVYPDDIGRPWASNLNLTPGMTRPNLVMVRVGAGGGVNFYNNVGGVHLVADVVGYYQTGAPVGTFAGRVIPLSSPFRAFDTRDYATRLGPQQREAWNFQPFVNSLDDGGNPVGPVGGLIMNVTSTAVTANSYLTMFPDDLGSVPVASNLNPVAGQNIPNLAVVPLPRGGGKANHLAAYNHLGYLHYLADVTAVVLAD